jgi:hypothetical protein
MAERDPAADVERLVREISALVDAVRTTLPPQLADALRELLVALRAVLDFSIARLDRPRAEPVRVEDIPID